MADRQVEHVDIPSQHQHEPKDISTADANSVYLSDGLGSGNWTVLPQFVRASAYPVGFIKPFAGTVVPAGWALCDGGLLSRNTYGRLFASIGTTYGVGDGATTFAKPNCKGRVLVGRDDMGGTRANKITRDGSGIDGEILGATGGSERVSLTTNNIPSVSVETQPNVGHTHENQSNRRRQGSGLPTFSPIFGTTGSFQTIGVEPAGDHQHEYVINNGTANDPHNNVQPTIIMNMIIYHGVA